MFQEFLNSHLNKAKYELIEEGKTYYGEIPDLRGVWATEKTLEECRKNLQLFPTLTLKILALTFSLEF